MPCFEISRIIRFLYKDFYGGYKGFRVYPIYRDKFGHYSLLGFSFINLFVTIICNSLPIRIIVRLKRLVKVKSFGSRQKLSRPCLKSLINAPLQYSKDFSFFIATHICYCLIPFGQSSITPVIS